MSFFNNKAGVTASTWGSMLKQAINTVESKIDKALDIGSENAEYQGEVYIDPMMGIIATIDKPEIPTVENDNSASSREFSQEQQETQDLQANAATSSSAENLLPIGTPPISPAVNPSSDTLIPSTLSTVDVSPSVPTAAPTPSPPPPPPPTPSKMPDTAQYNTNAVVSNQTIDANSAATRTSLSDTLVTLKQILATQDDSACENNIESFSHKSSESHESHRSIQTDTIAYTGAEEYNNEDTGMDSDEIVDKNSGYESSALLNASDEDTLDERSSHDDLRRRSKTSSIISDGIAWWKHDSAFYIHFADTARHYEEIIATKEQRLRDVAEQNITLNKHMAELRDKIMEIEENKDAMLKIANSKIDDLEKSLEQAKEAAQKVQRLTVTVDASQKTVENQRKLLLEKDEQIAKLVQAGEKSEYDKRIQIEELQKELEQLRTESGTSEDNLRIELRELRSTLVESEERAGKQEDALRKEIESLQHRLQLAESAKQEAKMEEWETERIQLIRRIDELQTQHALSKKNWEKTEIRLKSQLAERENERERLTKKEQSVKAELAELSSKLESTSLQLISERNEVSRLDTLVSTLRSQVSALTSQNSSLSADLSSLAESHSAELATLADKHSKELKELLQSKDDEWEAKLKSETERIKKDYEREKEKEKRKSNLTLDFSARSPTYNLRSTSETSLGIYKNDGWSGGRGEDGALTGIKSPMLFSPASSARSSIDGGNGVMGSVVMFEKLNNNVKQLEAQVANLQAQLQITTKNRDELSDELVRVTMQLEELKSKSANYDILSEEHAELNERYNTLLELLGEKTEEVEELQADLADVKQAFRAQITELCAKADQSKK